MRFLRHCLIGLFLLSLTLGLLAFAGQTVILAVQERMSREPRVPERRERVFAVNVSRADAQTIVPILTAYGEVQSRRTLELRAKSAGSVTYIAPQFREGGEVTAGEILLRIDPADAQSAFDRASSDLMDASAETREADRALVLARDELSAARDQADLRDRAFQRQKDLESRGVGTAAAVELAELAAAQSRQVVLGSRQAVAQAEARKDQAATRLRRAQIALAEAKRRLNDTVISAGFSGTLSDVTLVAGGTVSANERLAELIDGAALEVAFRISTAQYARLLDGRGRVIPAPLRVTLQSFGADLTSSGVITRDSGAVGEGLTGRLLFARIDTPKGMKPGDFVTVAVEEPALENVVRLPASALGPDGQVLVLDEADRLKAMPVILLRRQGDDILVHADGLAGHDVIRERAPVLGEGIKVRVLSDASRQREEASLMLVLSDARRARLITFVEGDSTLSSDARARMIATLSQARVPADVVRQLETRMGG
mgnify:CR=1 FL=1